MKKLILFIISALIMLSVALPAFADDTVYSEGYFKYTIDNESITIVGYFGSEETVEIPAAIAGIPVNAIGEGAFANTPSVKKILLPDCVVRADDGAFAPDIVVKYKLENQDEITEIDDVSGDIWDDSPVTDEDDNHDGKEADGKNNDAVDTVENTGSKTAIIIIAVVCGVVVAGVVFAFVFGKKSRKSR